MSKQPAYLKMSEIISLSNNYQHHRDNITQIKSAIDHSNKKRDKKIIKLREEKSRYGSAARNMQKNQIFRQNMRFVKRLQELSKPSIKKLQQQKSKRSLKSSLSSKSIHSMKDTLKGKAIQRQNIKMAIRILNPKSQKYLDLYELNKSYQHTQEIVKIRSRFSPKNKEIVASLALKTLNLGRKSLKFLPQINTKPRQKSNSSNY